MTRKNYTVHELIDDPSFRRVVRGIADLDELNAWNRWMEENDRNRKKFKVAASRILGFGFRDPKIPELDAQWEILKSRTTDRKEPVHATFERRSRSTMGWVIRMAAVYLLAVLVGLGVYSSSGNPERATELVQITQQRTVRTTEGERKTLRFSNGSEIILNSNSTLTYSLSLPGSQTIDVILEGEAFFKAEGDNSKKEPAFAVKTPEGIIRDIGTQFLITVEEGKSRVILQEGLVEVERIGGENRKADLFSIQKGELVEFDRLNILRREFVNATFYTSWATEFMEMDRTKLREFARYVEHQYGVTVQFEHPEMADITLSGAIYFKSLEELVQSVSDVTGIPVYKSAVNKTVYIGNPNYQ